MGASIAEAGETELADGTHSAAPTFDEVVEIAYQSKYAASPPKRLCLRRRLEPFGLGAGVGKGDHSTSAGVTSMSATIPEGGPN